jgi:hypothetical protein
MIRDIEKWEAFQAEERRGRPVDYERNVRLFEAMHEHARKMGALDNRDPMEGIDVRIRIARAINAEYFARKDRESAG